MNKKLITSFNCDLIECKCGSLIINKGAIVTACKKCGILYSKSGNVVYAPASFDDRNQESSSLTDNRIYN